ncbi:MAG: hypothetical protein AB9866_15860 [Syntrophobacteraceae bacterium]
MKKLILILSSFALLIVAGPLTGDRTLSFKYDDGPYARMVEIDFSLARESDGSYRAVVTVDHVGIHDFSEVTLTTAELGGVRGSPLPMSLGKLPGKRSVSGTIFFPKSAGETGSRVVFECEVICDGGSHKLTADTRLP